MSIYKRLRSFERQLDGQPVQEVTHSLANRRKRYVGGVPSLSSAFSGGRHIGWL